MAISDAERRRIHDKIVDLADDPDALTKFLKTEASKMTPDDRADLEDVARGAVQTTAMSGGPADLPQIDIDSIWDALETGVDPIVEEDEERQQVLDAANEKLEAGEELTPEEVSAAQEAELETASEFGQVDERELRLRWIREELQIPATQAETFTGEDENQILEWMAIFYGRNFGSFDELIESGYLDTPTAENRSIISAALEDQEPAMAFEVAVPGREAQFIRQRDFEGAKAAFGVDSKEISNYVKLAAMANMYGGDGESIVWQPLMALANATGALRRAREEQAAIAQRASQAVEQADEQGAIDAVLGVAREVLGEDDPDRRFGDWVYDMQGVEPPSRDMPDNLPSDVLADSMTASRDANDLSIRNLGRQYNEGLERYADAGLAFIFAVDSNLAQRMALAYENDGKVTDADQASALRIIANAGFNDPKELGDALLGAGYAEVNAFKFFGRGGDIFDIDDLLEEAQGSERILSMPDPEAVRSNVKSLYRQLFLEDPTEDQIQQFSSQVTNIMVSNQKREDVSQQTDDIAQLTNIFEDTDLYQQLYRNKPGGMSEVEYQNRFRIGEASILGEAGGEDLESVRQGMLTGDMQTTVGAAMASDEAWDNSTWMGRLARTARAVSDMT